MRALLAALLLALAAPAPAAAETVRVATYTTELAAEGPGLLLRDIRRDDAPRAAAVAAVVARVAPDILVLQGVDWDAAGDTLDALAGLIAEAGPDYPHRLAARPNAGMATGLDLDGDRRLGRARDAQGYGRFAGQGGMAILSRWPLAMVRDLTPMLWRDLPDAAMPGTPSAPFPSREAAAAQRLSSVAHWDVAVAVPNGPPLRLLTWHGTPPVFDGPEDRNGLRNHDEAALWLAYLDGALGPAPAPPLAVIGNANLDPRDGDGLPRAIERLLAHPALTDPAPASGGGPAAAALQGGSNAAHDGDPALDTADWSDDGPGNLRVSYLLPSRDVTIAASGVFWPAPDDPDAALLTEDGSRHRLVWADLVLPGPAD